MDSTDCQHVLLSLSITGLLLCYVNITVNHVLCEYYGDVFCEYVM